LLELNFHSEAVVEKMLKLFNFIIRFWFGAAVEIMTKTYLLVLYL